MAARDLLWKNSLSNGKVCRPNWIGHFKKRLTIVHNNFLVIFWLVHHTAWIILWTHQSERCFSSRPWRQRWRDQDKWVESRLLGDIGLTYSAASNYLTAAEYQLLHFALVHELKDARGEFVGLTILVMIKTPSQIEWGIGRCRWFFQSLRRTWLCFPTRYSSTTMFSARMRAKPKPSGPSWTGARDYIGQD